MNRDAFKKELSDLINRHCIENGSNTPDYMLADYLFACLENFERTTQQRETWYGRDARPGALILESPPTGGCCRRERLEG